jgi:hypothetical protein
MKILAVPLPFELLVEGFVSAALRQRFANAQPAAGWMSFALRLAQTTDPPAGWTVGAVLAEAMMHFVNEAQSEFRVALVASGARQTKKIAYCEGVRPQIPPRVLMGGEPGALPKIFHERDSLFDLCIRHGFRGPLELVVIDCAIHRMCVSSGVMHLAWRTQTAHRVICAGSLIRDG